MSQKLKDKALKKDFKSLLDLVMNAHHLLKKLRQWNLQFEDSQWNVSYIVWLPQNTTEDFKFWQPHLEPFPFSYVFLKASVKCGVLIFFGFSKVALINIKAQQQQHQNTPFEITQLPKMVQ